MRSLVTGATGFVGQYLMQLLVEKGHEVCGTFHRNAGEFEFSRCRLERLDILEKEPFRKLLLDFKPDEIYHLAAIAITTNEEREPYYLNNFLGTVNLFEAVLETLPRCRVLFVGSANTYGPVPVDKQPIKEEEILRPVNHYAASKAAADMAACAYAEGGMHVVRVRPFNHAGPGQTTDYVCSRLSKQVAEVSLGLREPVIDVGNLDAARDFTDVRDVVRAYRLLLQNGQPGEAYNVCSQIAFSVREIVSILARNAGLEIEVKTRPDLLRITDIPILVGNREKIFRATGWEPEIPFTKTLADLLTWWERMLKGGNG